MNAMQYSLWSKPVPDEPKVERKEINRIASLYQPTEKEHQFAILAYPLLHGREVNGQWLQIAKLNNPSNKDDEAIYLPDFSVLADGEIIGYLDVESKPRWLAGSWPYPVTNIAKHPIGHWEDNRFNGRLTNKLRAFREKPDMSFWAGVRIDWQACWIIRARDIFLYGTDAMQDTRYSDVALPVIQVPNMHGMFCDSAEALTSYVMAAFMLVAA